MQADGSEVRGHPRLHSEFKASLGYARTRQPQNKAFQSGPVVFKFVSILFSPMIRLGALH